MNSCYTTIHVGGSDTAQPLNVRKRLDVIERHLRPNHNRFLDCGCGAGDYVFQLVERFGLDSYGIEFDVEKVEHARRHPQHGHRISAGDLQALALGSNEWDYAMLNEVLEHVPDDNAALREVYRILKPSGILFLYSPNRSYPFETHGVYLRRSGKYVPYWMPFVPYIPLSVGNRFFRYWARNYWHEQLTRLVTSAGLSVVETGYLWQTFEGISGRQPKIISLTKNLLRSVSNACESTYFVKRFGVSQFLVCQK
jgi:ubiquinone/menaquinone biosynthesis C-methylase UbiE